MKTTSNPLTNIEAEAILLGTLMMPDSAGFVDIIADKINSSDFSEPLHARIFDIILHQHAQGKPASPVLIKEYLKDDEGLKDMGGASYLANLTADGSGLLALREIADQIKDLAHRRCILAGLQDAVAGCVDLAVSHADIISRADAALDIGEGDSTIVEMTGGECIDDLIKSFGREDASGVLCGKIPDLDDVLGPLRRKQLVIVAARPGQGKTATALSYALGAARNGHATIFVSLEMAALELSARMAADLCFDGCEGVPYHVIQQGRLNDWQLHRVIEARSHINNLPLHIIDAGNFSIGRLNSMIRRHARRLTAQGRKLELVIVDYLQLLRTDQQHRSAYEAISEISRSLKLMAKDQDITIMALAQLSREVEKRENKRPQLSDLRDSGSIEQDADSVLFLLRQEYYLSQSEPELFSAKYSEWEAQMEQSRGKIEFICAKQRSGVTGSSTGRFHGSYQAVR